MAKCLNHPRRNSASVDEDSVPPLCNECWETRGQPVKPGDKVICISAHPDCSGTVTRVVDGSIAVTETLDGGESWNPVALLVRWKSAKTFAAMARRLKPRHP